MPACPQDNSLQDDGLQKNGPQNNDRSVAPLDQSVGGTPADCKTSDGDAADGDAADGDAALAPAIVRGSQSALKAAELQTRALARSRAENFLVASVLLPRRLRQPFYNVYAYCRTADDLADEAASPAEALARLSEFGRQLGDIYEGRPVAGLFVALGHTIAQFDLPRQPFEDLLDAFRQDQHKQRYANFDELLHYCRRSANPVGRIVLCLGGCLDEQNALLSDQICTGLQLANCWQDVARDHSIGRVYLPLDAMARHGVDEEMFTAATTPGPLRDLLSSECDRAEGFLRRGIPLAERVPRWFSADIRLFVQGGLATIEAIRRIDFDVLGQRPTTAKHRRLWMLAKAAVGRW